MKLTEHEIQNQIREYFEFTPVQLWRVNVLAGFAGNYSRTKDGGVYIKQPRFVKSGVPAGFPDLIGILPLTITDKLLGQTIGQFCYIEVKTEKGKISEQQKLLHIYLDELGAKGGIARNLEDAKQLILS